jgi:hypothetical protein
MDVDKIYALDCFLILGRMYAKKNDSIHTIEYYQKPLLLIPRVMIPL